MKDLEKFFEELEDDIGDVSSFEDPEILFSKMLELSLTAYNERTGLNIPFQRFSLSTTAWEMREYPETRSYMFYFRELLPDSKLVQQLLDDLTFYARVHRGQRYVEIDLDIRLWGNHIVKNLATYYSVGSDTVRLARLNGKDIKE